MADFTYIKTKTGWVYTAFVIDVFKRVIVGWRVSDHMNTQLVLNALNQALAARNSPKGVIHHSDKGSQYLSIKYGEQLKQSGLADSVGITGDSTTGIALRLALHYRYVLRSSASQGEAMPLLKV